MEQIVDFFIVLFQWSLWRPLLLDELAILQVHATAPHKDHSKCQHKK
jgi:hypothetical protein